MGLTNKHKQKISKSLNTLTIKDIIFLKENRDKYSVAELSMILDMSKSSIYRVLKANNIKLSSKGKARAKKNSAKAHKGKTPWNKGKSLSDKTKKKIGKAVSGTKNGQYSRGMTEKEKEKWRASYNSNGIHKMREWVKSPAGQKAQKKSIKKTTSAKFSNAASTRAAKQIKSGKFKTFSWKQGWITTKKCGKIFIKSSWEKLFAENLDKDDNVISAQYEPIAIRYNYKGRKKNYYPDFIVRMKNGTIKLYEIKPKKLINYGKNKPKAAAGRRFCRKMGWKYEIITEDVLFA